MSHVAEFYGLYKYSDVKSGILNLLNELYFDTEFERDFGDHHYLVEDNSTFNARAEYKYDPTSKICHIQIWAGTREILRSLTRAFSSSADGHFSSWYCIVDEVGSKHSQRSFVIIHDIENLLRSFILKTLMKTHGDEWVNHLGLPKNKVREAHQRSRRMSDVGTGEYIAKLCLLHYVNFYDLITILEKASDKNGEKGSLFEETQVINLSDGINELRKIRNDMAHNRFLTQSKFQTVNREAMLIKSAIMEDTTKLLSLDI